VKININTDAVVKFTDKLERIHRSALPIAIRSTLNSAAFDVKKTTMPATSKATFTNRVPNFFKANSRVEMAKGFNIREMKAIVGFVDKGLKGTNNYAVKELEQQEHGGNIEKKSFIPTDKARGGKTRAVRPGNRLSSINKVVNSYARNNPKQAFIKAAIKVGPGGHVIGNFQKKIMWRIDSIDRSGTRMKIKKTPLYSYQKNRSVHVKATGFMKEASQESANKMQKYYIREAEKQIKRLRK